MEENEGADILEARPVSNGPWCKVRTFFFFFQLQKILSLSAVYKRVRETIALGPDCIQPLHQPL